MTDDLRYTSSGVGGYNVWGDRATKRLGRVVKVKTGWRAITPDGRDVGLYSAMSRAGGRLADEAGQQ
jgi:hypothetical protein